jgi:hypothetical protein
MTLELQEYVAGQIWLCSYPMKYLGMQFSARMTALRLADGRLMLHSPCEIDNTSSGGRISELRAPHCDA